MEDLKPEEVDELHRELLVLNEELQLLVDSSESGSRPVDLDQPIGRLSRMDAIAQQNMVQANRRSAQMRIQRIQMALTRIANGEYGNCMVCGELIGLQRLKGQPEAPFCIACQ
ncbi:MAG: TraR/DksA C4-type zinc finger protein, partial [Myxococcota bacterium]|nr:TraR/DksA C4-type zinc finger protein [Myxococcota bacterium]